MSKEILGVIGGSGIGAVLADHIKDSKKVEIATPFGNPSSDLLIGSFNGREIAFINRHGGGHRFDPSSVAYRANIYALKSVGVKSCIASAAVGSLREEIAPRDIVIVDQIIDKTYKRESSFFTGKAAVHCEMAEPYCHRLRDNLIEAAQNLDVKTHSKATYVCMEGPQFSTKAEAFMHRSWGGDLIGMTGMPEAKLAREAQICFALVAMPSDYDCWREAPQSKDKQDLLGEIIGNLNSCTENFIKLLSSLVNLDNELISDSCQCRASLDIAVWSDLELFDSMTIEVLETLKR